MAKSLAQLMLDADPEYLDTVWDAALAPGLARSWAEPIPVRARAWLGLRIGYEWSPGTLDLRLIDWEIRTARIAEERLRAGETEGALAVLRERTERTAASPLTRLEAQALSALGRQDEAVGNEGDRDSRRCDRRPHQECRRRPAADERSEPERDVGATRPDEAGLRPQAGRRLRRHDASGDRAFRA